MLNGTREYKGARGRFCFNVRGVFSREPKK